MTKKMSVLVFDLYLSVVLKKRMFLVIHYGNMEFSVASKSAMMDNAFWKPRNTEQSFQLITLWNEVKADQLPK